jgi:hypothetical protein
MKDDYKARVGNGDFGVGSERPRPFTTGQATKCKVNCGDQKRETM